MTKRILVQTVAEDVTPQLAYRIRQMGLKTHNWEQISRDSGQSRNVVQRILEAAWDWRYARCSSCRERFAWRCHVDYQRSYGRCSDCAAADWHEALCSMRARGFLNA